VESYYYRIDLRIIRPDVLRLKRVLKYEREDEIKSKRLNLSRENNFEQDS